MGEICDGTRKEGQPDPSSSAAFLRWRILRRALLPTSGKLCDDELVKVSRVPAGRYNLLHCHQVVSSQLINSDTKARRDVLLEYTLPSSKNDLKKLLLWQRANDHNNPQNLIAFQEHHVDYTGVVCLWPAEEVLTHFCVSNPEIFRGKHVIEIGAGYGLGGLAIAAWTNALAVTISDGNPMVVDYINCNISANAHAFGATEVSAALLDWSTEDALSERKFDVIVGADCTFRKELHLDLAHTIKRLLDASEGSHAILFSPSRGASLETFVEVAKTLLLHVDICMMYDTQVWDLHQQYLGPDKQLWPNYDDDHCYPLLVSISNKRNLNIRT
ncbi:hypothetical protein O6H91_07G045700 [Diphasiastrum complanatum]|uniref:Uncharacterized protein n=1 Tax=Diphasiastrum complanatum TaxID=34168 RepID=A0ACC2D4M5_DIPCM|nr:hypothetical protein O6H91_07G045700 [Diphasiastrum complanatum]